MATRVQVQREAVRARMGSLRRLLRLARTAAKAVDDAVPNAEGVPDAHLGPTARHVWWLGPLYLVFAIVLIPWTTYLAFVLPSHQLNVHYDVAWFGFDVGLLVVLLWTAFAAMRRSTWLPIAATSAACLLLTDAWFDVVTSASASDRVQAIASALLLELPTAAVSAWLARGGQRLAARQFYLGFLRGRRRS